MLDRLKRRKLFQWSLAYLAGAWLLMQIVDVLSDRWPLPIALQRGVDLLLLVGLFFTVTLAWYHGDKGRQNVSGPELLILTALLVLAGGLMSLLRTGDGVTPLGSGSPASTWPASVGVPGIAVLPFRNLSGDPEQDYFVSGMHEALIASLSQIRDLKVISRTSVMRYSETDKPIPTIASELQVSSVMEGSVNTVGGRVRIAVRLIDGVSDGLIWSEGYDRDLRDVLVMMSQVAESVAAEVEVTLAPEEERLLASAGQVDPQVHDLFMRGRYAYGFYNAAGLVQAIDYFQKAIEIDDTYAPAWAGLSGSHILATYMGFLPVHQAIATAEQAAIRAVELGPDLSSAHTALGWVRLFQFDWEEARRLFARALDLNPNQVDALHGFGDYLTITGSAADGMAFVRRSRDNDPFSPIWGHPVVHHLFLMRDYEQVFVEGEAVLASHPSPLVWRTLGHANWQLGRYEAAIDNYRTAFANRRNLLDALEVGYENNGPGGAVAAIAATAAGAAAASDAVTLEVALWYARAGDADATMDWLNRAYESRAPDLVYLSVRPELEFLHDDRRLLELLSKMKLSLH